MKLKSSKHSILTERPQMGNREADEMIDVLEEKVWLVRKI